MGNIIITVILFPLFLSSIAVSAPEKGAVEGTLIPPDGSARITAVQAGITIAMARPGEKDGKFRLELAAGTYGISVSVPTSSFPIRLEGVVVKPGETTALQPLRLLPGSGKAVLEGRIVPPRPGSEVMLIRDGKERAAVRTDQEGRYEFRELPAGRYEVRATAPGHSADVATIVVPENQIVRQAAVLFPVVATDGVDWAAGTIRATGAGAPPPNAANAGSSRAMARRAALADAERNLLRTIEQIRIGGGRTVGHFMRSGNGKERIQGFVKGYKVVNERELASGGFEVTLELPLAGPSGLSRYVIEPH